MNKKEFLSTSCALLGTTVGWQTKIAHLLGVSDRTVRRWIKADDIPEWAEEKLAELVGLSDPVRVLPRDKFFIGDGAPDERGHRREYIMHLHPPMFIARIVALDDIYGQPLPTEQPVNLNSGEGYYNGEEMLCEIIWIDKPKVGEVVDLMEAACNFIDESGLS